MGILVINKHYRRLLIIDNYKFKMGEKEPTTKHKNVFVKHKCSHPMGWGLSPYGVGGGGGGVGGLSHFFSSYVGSGPASTVHPTKISGTSSTPKKNSPILYLDLKKDLKMTPKYSPIL